LFLDDRLAQLIHTVNLKRVFWPNQGLML
jgi:hypothetical protein